MDGSDGQCPAVDFIVINHVLNALTGEDEAPIHRLPAAAGGNQGVKQ